MERKARGAAAGTAGVVSVVFGSCGGCRGCVDSSVCSCVISAAFLACSTRNAAFNLRVSCSLRRRRYKDCAVGSSGAFADEKSRFCKYEYKYQCAGFFNSRLDSLESTYLVMLQLQPLH